MDTPRVPRLSLDLLRGFRAAARQLSFTRAAQELCVTQPAISREVKTLEQQLGTPLFRRVNRSLQLTQAGEALYRAADEALAIVDAATQRLVQASRSLSVSTTVALASTWLVPRLPHFTRMHPDIDMRLVASNEHVDLQREHIDVWIRYVPPGMPPSSGEKLFDYEQFPVCSPMLAGPQRPPLATAADLERHVLLDFETSVYGRPWSDWQTWLGAKKLTMVRAAGSLRFSHYDQVVEAAIKGGGVAVGKRPHLNRHLQDGVLVAPLGDHGVARLGGFHLELADAAPRGASDVFVAWLHAQARQDADALRGREPPLPQGADARPSAAS